MRTTTIDVSRSLSRRALVAGIAAAASATLLPRHAAAGGPQPGPWCRELSKVARDDAFELTAALLDGGGTSFTLSEHLGTPVWVQFFTTWCPPCNAEAADVVRIAQKYRDVVTTVGIDVGEAAETVRDFRTRHGVTYPIALDERAAIFHGLGLRNYPTHLFFDANGKISCLSIGDMTPEQFENEIAVALARPAAPHWRTSPAPAPSAAR